MFRALIFCTSWTITPRRVLDAKPARALAIDTAMFGFFQMPSCFTHDRSRNSSVSLSITRNNWVDSSAPAASTPVAVQPLASAAIRPGCHSPVPQYDS
ncbi:hypothetical protein A7R75_10545 [Mycolicibacterium llatzerense]|nr:hypothetical protein [Mycolicibacterium llatzerense]